MLSPFLGIMGCTGVGKSATAVQLAKKFNGEIVSCDSMQIYRKMDIGTAKVTATEMQGVTHHLIDVVDANESFSAFDFITRANECIEDITARGKLPIVVGGTGMYFSSLLYGLDNQSDAKTMKLRKELQEKFANEGILPLVKMLKSIDPIAYDVVDLKNAKRVMRAIEIASSGGTIVAPVERTAKRKCTFIVLDRPREDIYSAIDDRVDRMIMHGLIDEVAEVCNEILYGNNLQRNATVDYSEEQVEQLSLIQSLQAIGYKEVVQYLGGECDLVEVINAIKQNSRRYAKRQITYFKKLPCSWININEVKGVDELCESIVSIYNSEVMR